MKILKIILIFFLDLIKLPFIKDNEHDEHETSSI